MWDCEECVRRLDELVDKELNGIEVEEVQAHFNECGDCTRRYRFQTELKRLVKVSSAADVAPADLREKLRQQLGA